MKTPPEGLLDEITRRLVAELKPEQIILFGSHVWGKPDDESDLDFLVIVRRSRYKPTQRATRAYRALRGLFVPIDILVKTQAEVERFRGVPASLECEILERGRNLYGRSKARVRAGVDIGERARSGELEQSEKFVLGQLGLPEY